MLLTTPNQTVMVKKNENLVMSWNLMKTENLQTPNMELTFVDR
jgi:hypothetical protein